MKSIVAIVRHLRLNVFSSLPSPPGSTGWLLFPLLQAVFSWALGLDLHLSENKHPLYPKLPKSLLISCNSERGFYFFGLRDHLVSITGDG